MSKVLGWFAGFPAPLTIFLVSMIPVIELRGAILWAGSFSQVPWLEVYVLSVLGNMLPIPFIILLGRQILDLLKKVKWLRKFAHRLELRTLEKSQKVKKYTTLGLIAFVAIPLPGTGAWTGALIACLLNMSLRRSLPAIFIGVLIAGLLVSGVTYGFIGFLQL